MGFPECIGALQVQVGAEADDSSGEELSGNAPTQEQPQEHPESHRNAGEAPEASSGDACGGVGDASSAPGALDPSNPTAEGLPRPLRPPRRQQGSVRSLMRWLRQPQEGARWSWTPR